MENSIISAFLQMVMKMNEALFKPLFLKIVDWATSELLAKHGMNASSVPSIVYLVLIIKYTQ